MTCRLVAILSLPLVSCTASRHPPIGLAALQQLESVNGFAFSRDMQTAFVALRVDEKDARGRPRARIFARDWTGTGWGSPRTLSFSGRHTDYQPVISPDGKRLYYTSTRPLTAGGPEVRQNVWEVPVRGGGFGEPRAVRETVTNGWDGHAVQTASGAIYFASDAAGHTDIWMMRPHRGGFSRPVNLAAVNTAAGESDLYVDPHERYLIFGRYHEASKETDLFVSMRRKGAWLPARSLAMVNRPGWELSPTVTPDSRWFMFQRDGKVHVMPWRDVQRSIESLFHR